MTGTESAEPTTSADNARFERWAPFALALAVIAVYAPSLGGGFFNWDDPWLIEHNSLLAHGGPGALRAIAFDLSLRTRLTLGAEYLPIRDLSVWLELHVFGPNPHLMRAVQLAIYVAGVLLMRAALLRTFVDRRFAEITAWAFALHPVHAESVAWLAGRKDVLALLFTAAALWVYAGRHRQRWVWVSALLLAAHWSKSQSVTAVGLLLATDLVAERRPEYKTYAAAIAVAALALAIDVIVGHRVGMTTLPAGGSRWTAAATMGPVWLRYLVVSIWPPSLSVVHDVAARTHWDGLAIAGWVVLAGWAAAGVWLWRRRQRAQPLVLFAWLWFAVPLLPVSQIVFPLQNRMADRYLLWSVLAVAVAIGALSRVAVGGARSGVLLSSALLCVAGGATLYRALLFADSASAFRDATGKTTASLVAPYQLGQALEARGNDDAARVAYEETLRRSVDAEEPARRATNNLAKLYARAHRLDDAEKILRRGLELWPNDSKMVGNLAKVLYRSGRPREANAVMQRLRRGPTAAPSDVELRQRHE